MSETYVIILALIGAATLADKALCIILRLCREVWRS
jgi:hypothetical protein